MNFIMRKKANKANNNGAKPVVEEKKPLSPQQLQKRKKMVIFPLFFLLFAVSMWLIFAHLLIKMRKREMFLIPTFPRQRKAVL